MKSRPNHKIYIFALILTAFFLIPSFVYLRGYAGDSASSQVSPGSEAKVPPFGMPMEEAVLEQGKKTYELYCMGCHGVNGDGKGPSAAMLDPKPRNFKLAEFRISSRPSGSLPTDQDLYNSIALGLHGTSMPSWNLLPENERRAVIAYIKTFAADRWKSEGERIPTAISEDPFSGNSEKGFKKGEIAYHGIAACYSCHPAYVGPEKVNEARASYQMPPILSLRANPGLPEAKADTEGYMLKPPDFEWDSIKRETDLESLYQVIANGISGTAMPSWKGILSEEDIWGMAYYLRALADQRKKLVTVEDLKNRDQKIKQLAEEYLQFEKKSAEAAQPVQPADSETKVNS